jgi:hypothetical protein
MEPPPKVYPPTDPVKVMAPPLAIVVNPAPQFVAEKANELLHVTLLTPTVIVIKALASARGSHISASAITAVAAINILFILDPAFLGFQRCRY